MIKSLLLAAAATLVFSPVAAQQATAPGGDIPAKFTPPTTGADYDKRESWCRFAMAPKLYPWRGAERRDQRAIVLTARRTTRRAVPIAATAS